MPSGLITAQDASPAKITGTGGWDGGSRTNRSSHPIDRLRVATLWRVHGDLRQLPPRNAHNAETVGGQDAATVVLDEARAAALFRQAFTSSGTM